MKHFRRPSRALSASRITSVVASSVFASGVLFAGCSSSQSHPAPKQNTVSPYDREFDPDKETSYSPESVDTPELTLLDQAKDAYDRGLYSVAKENWQKLHDGYPTSAYSTLAELKIADCSFYSGDYAAAATAYEEFIKLHPGHESAAYAHYQLGRSSQEQYTGPEHDQAPLFSAMKHYQTLIDLAPEHEYATLARQAIAECRERLAQHELVVAHFYRKQDAQNAEVGRLRRIVADYPESRAAREAGERLAELGEKPATGTLATVGPKPVTPAAPRLVYRGETPREGNSGVFSAPLAALKTDIKEQPIDLRAKQRNQPSGEGKRLVQALTCDTVGQFHIATAYLDRRLVIAAFREPRKEQAAVLTLAPKVDAAEVLDPLDSAAQESCTASGITVSTRESANESALVNASIDGVTDRRRIHYFSLDRPDRLVILVDRNGEQTVATRGDELTAPVIRSARRVYEPNL